MLYYALNVIIFVGLFFIGLILGSLATFVVNSIDARIKGSVREPLIVATKRRLGDVSEFPLISLLYQVRPQNDVNRNLEMRNSIAELFSGALTIVLYLKFGVTEIFFLYLALFVGLIAIFRVDQDMMVIPDLLSLPLLGLGFAASVLGVIPGVTWLDSLLGISLGVVILYAPAKIFEYAKGVAGLGGGDIKLLAMVGAWTSIEGVIFTLFFAALSGFVMSLVPMLGNRVSLSEPIPFGPYLASAAMIYIVFGSDLVDKLMRLRSYY